MEYTPAPVEIVETWKDAVQVARKRAEGKGAAQVSAFSFSANRNPDSDEVVVDHEALDKRFTDGPAAQEAEGALGHVPSNRFEFLIGLGLNPGTVQENGIHMWEQLNKRVMYQQSHLQPDVYLVRRAFPFSGDHGLVHRTTEIMLLAPTHENFETFVTDLDDRTNP